MVVGNVHGRRKKMTRDEAIQILRKLYNEIQNPVNGELSAIDMAISALSVLDQIRWERDIALETLEEHGIGLGQKAEPTDLISRADALQCKPEFLNPICNWNEGWNKAINEWYEALKTLPSVSAERSTLDVPLKYPCDEIVRCKDCIYYDKGENEVDAWECCTRNAHSTQKENYCAWAERREP